MDFKIFNKNLMKLIVSGLFIIFLLKFINFQLLFESLENVNNYFFLALLLIPFNIFLRALRWLIIINKDNKLISLVDSLSLTLVGIGLNIFLPASSGDIAKSYYGYKWHGFKEEMFSSSIADKFIALLALFIVGVITAFLIKLYYLSIFLLVLTIFFIILIFLPNYIPWTKIKVISSKIFKVNFDKEKLEQSFELTDRTKLLVLLISIIAWFLTYLQFFIVCKSFNLNIGLFYVLAVSPLITLSTLLPFTVNGIGTGEVVTTYLFSLIGISPTMAILVSLISSQLLCSIIPGLFGLAIILKK